MRYLIERTAEKAGVIGSIVSAMGCAACFPALASLGAAIGLGFLSRYEGTFIRYVLPFFALVALAANLAAGMRHRQWPRAILGLIGPALVFAAAVLMATFGVPTEWLLYPGLLLMIAMAVWDLISPPGRTRVYAD
jgi:mercuric ion transport protein